MPEAAKRLSIGVDTRELNGTLVKHWHAYSGNFPGLEQEPLELEYGDYVIGAGAIVERKSSTDFMLSVMDKKIFGNIAKLKAEFDQIIYVVEGDIFAPRFHSNPAALRDALAYMSAAEGVALIPSPDAAMSAELVYDMAMYIQRGDDNVVSVHTRKPKDLRSSQQYLIESLPGVTAERARDLLRAFGNAAAVLGASDSQLQAAGLSIEAVTRIRKILETQWT